MRMYGFSTPLVANSWGLESSSKKNRGCNSKKKVVGEVASKGSNSLVSFGAAIKKRQQGSTHSVNMPLATNTAHIAQTQQNANANVPMIKICPDNAFSLSVPVKSQTIVNRVVVEYMTLVKDEQSDGETATVQSRDCVWEVDHRGARKKDGSGNYIFTATVGLEKFYERIRKIHVYSVRGVNNAIINVSTVAFISVEKATPSTLTLKFSASANFSRYEIQINPN